MSVLITLYVCGGIIAFFRELEEVGFAGAVGIAVFYPMLMALTVFVFLIVIPIASLVFCISSKYGQKECQHERTGSYREPARCIHCKA